MDILSGIVQEIIGNWLAVALAAAAIGGGGFIMLLFKRTRWPERILYGLISIASILVIWHVLVEPEIPHRAPSVEELENNIRDWAFQAGYSVKDINVQAGEKFHYILDERGRITIHVFLRYKPPERYVVIENRMKPVDKHTELYNQLTNYEKKRFAALLALQLTSLGIEYKIQMPGGIIFWTKTLTDQMTNSDMFLNKILLIKGATITVRNVFVLHLEKESISSDSI